MNLSNDAGGSRRVLPIFLDLETIPGQAPHVTQILARQAEEEKAQLRAPGNYKDPAKIEQWLADEANRIDRSVDERYRKTALDGSLGQIAVASIAVGDEAPMAFFEPIWTDSHAEGRLLRNLYRAVEDHASAAVVEGLAVVFVGHNVINFDLRFLFQRSVILGVVPPRILPLDAGPYDHRVFDTMIRWTGDRRSYVSMDNLCAALGEPGKGDEIDGSKVWDFVQAGDIDKVADYCNGDIERTRRMYRRLSFLQDALPLAA